MYKYKFVVENVIITVITMALIHANSCECAKSELDLFGVPPTMSSVEGGHWQKLGTITALSDEGPYEFVISGSGEDYVDLGNTNLMVRARIMKADGTNIGDQDDVGPINLWLHSLFGDVTVSLNEKLISPPTNAYAYRAYIETLLSYGSEAKKSQLTAAMWYGDTAGKFENRDDENKGFKSRKELTETSKIVEMMGKLHSDLFQQERYLINNVDVKVRLTRNKDAFCLMGNGEYKINIKEIYLMVRKVRLTPAVRMAHVKALQQSVVKYPINRVEMKVYAVPRGDMTSTNENLFLGQLPKRIIVGCVDDDAFNGRLTKNPFHFKHNKINFLVMYLDGKQIPSDPLKPDFTRGNYVRAFANLFNATGKMYQDEGNGISMRDFGQGYTLFAFDLTPDLCELGTFHLIKSGNVKLEIHFAEPLAATVNVIVYVEFDNIIEIDRHRQILFDFSA